MGQTLSSLLAPVVPGWKVAAHAELTSCCHIWQGGLLWQAPQNWMPTALNCLKGLRLWEQNILHNQGYKITLKWILSSKFLKNWFHFWRSKYPNRTLLLLLSTPSLQSLWTLQCHGFSHHDRIFKTSKHMHTHIHVYIPICNTYCTAHRGGQQGLLKVD